MVESLNAPVVIEEHRTGSRYFWNEVHLKNDRLSAIAARYVERIPCPSKDWEERDIVPFILQHARQVDTMHRNNVKCLNISLN